MRIAILSAAIVAASAGTAFAQCNLDQNAATNNAYMAAFSQGDLAQSFQHQVSNSICGAGIFLQPGVGGTDNVTIDLWTTLPNGGGQMLASGSAQGTQGQWVDVTWTPVAISANTTYYLHFHGNSTLGISGDIANGYPFGQVYANPGFGSFPGYDYTFRTTSGSAGFTIRLSGPCPGQKTLSWTGAGSGQMGIVVGNSQGNTVIPFGPCQGTQLGIQGGLFLYNVIGTNGGTGQVTGTVGTQACGKFVQCINTGTCATSNVAGPI